MTNYVTYINKNLVKQDICKAILYIIAKRYGNRRLISVFVVA